MKKSTHKILFVDDDPLIIRGLARSVDQYDDFWDIDFVLSGEEALQIMETTQYDAIVTDLLMPKMNGLALLEAVQKKFPVVLRFVLSGNASDVNSVKAAFFVHQVFPKPCPIDQLFNRVEDACKLKDKLNNQNLTRLVTSIHSLPSRPKLFNKLIEEVYSDEPNLKVISEIISNEPSMSAKALQLVNSAFFGLANKVTDINQAVRLLGINTITALVYSSQIFSEFEKSEYLPASIRNIWDHSIYVSQFARQFADEFGLSKQQQENAQVSGLLHDIGKLLGLKIPMYYEEFISAQGNLSVEDEYKLFGTSHAELGAYLLGIWGLPIPIVENVMLYHNPQNKLSNDCSSLTALHLANGLLRMYDSGEEVNYQAFINMDYLLRLFEKNELDNILTLFRQKIDKHFDELEN